MAEIDWDVLDREQAMFHNSLTILVPPPVCVIGWSMWVWGGGFSDFFGGGSSYRRARCRLFFLNFLFHEWI